MISSPISPFLSKLATPLLLSTSRLFGEGVERFREMDGCSEGDEMGRWIGLLGKKKKRVRW